MTPTLTVAGRLNLPDATSNTSTTHSSGSWTLAFTRKGASAGAGASVVFASPCRFFRPFAHPRDVDQPHHCAFVNAPFGDRALRLECSEHEPADAASAAAAWQRFVSQSGVA
ncbi:MAG: hypothetical protein ACT443_16025 [Gemmatimonadota bacterium]